jgi:tRNA1Val (adenine37-N6)-methyltransferase
MKVGTDGVLLGAWANIVDAGQILDVGSGTGLIAIMLAQRTNAFVEAVEVEYNAYQQAKINIALCPWEKRIRIHNLSFQEFCSSNQKLFDLIVCNPPYYKNSLKASKQNRNMARHTDTLSHSDLLSGVSKLLSGNGRFSVIMAYNEGCNLNAQASEFGLFCIRKTNVKTKPDSSIKRLLLEFSKTPENCKEDLLVIGTDTVNRFSEQYMQLSKDFYLAF